MDESILTSIKKLLGIQDDYPHFDQDIIMHINTVFSILSQLGIGPAEGFSISDSSATWSSYLQNNLLLEQVKSYMYLRVRLLFDPPASGTIVEVMNRNAAELEWRICNSSINSEDEGE